MTLDGLPAQLAVALLSAALGWLAGYVSALITDRIEGPEAPSSGPRGPLLRDRLVQSLCALSWAAIVVVRGDISLSTMIAALLSTALVQISVTDLRYRYVLTPIPIAVGLAAALLSPLHFGFNQWYAGALGGLTATVVFLLIYWVGRLAYRGKEPLARGDIYIAGMIGAITGPKTANALVWGIVASGLVALGVVLLRRDRQAYIPYGPGLCVGALVALLAVF